MCVLSSLLELKNISIKDYVCIQHSLIKLQGILTAEVLIYKHSLENSSPISFIFLQNADGAVKVKKLQSKTKKMEAAM